MTTAYITDSRFAEHTLEGHVEFAGRLTAIHSLLDKYNVVSQMVPLTASPATDAQLRTVHTQEYLDMLQWTTTRKGLMLGPDTYALPQSYGVAKLSAGAAIRGVDAVLSGEANNALVCARPPGHHATPQSAMGFCLLGNVSIAARHAQNAHGLKRVLIVDYDVHHGNGTQEIFYEDPSVMFISTHQFPWYPGTGAVTETGKGAGLGATLNIPVEAGTGDEGFGLIYEQIVWPAARRFAPELIIVSMGFDAHWADPLGRLQLSLKGYDLLSRELIAMAEALCGGKIVFVLEGGYNLISLSNGVLNVAQALVGDPQLIDPLGQAKDVEPDVEPLISQIKQIHNL